MNHKTPYPKYGSSTAQQNMLNNFVQAFPPQPQAYRLRIRAGDIARLLLIAAVIVAFCLVVYFLGIRQ